MSKTIEEHKYWCPDYPNCCTNEHDIKYCEGEVLRRYTESVDRKTRELSDDELSDNEIKDYVNEIMNQSDIIIKGGGCNNNQCGGNQLGGNQLQYGTKESFSKWTIPNKR